MQPYDSGQPWYLNLANGLTTTLLYFSYVPAFAGGFGLLLLSFAGAFWLLGWVLQSLLTALLWIISLPLRGLASLLSRRSLYKYLLGSSLAGTILAILLPPELGCIQFRFRRGGYPEGQILIGSHL